MSGTPADRAIKNDAEQLVDLVSSHWPRQAMRPVYADMQYGQYAEAVLNLIAVSHKEGLKLTASETRTMLSLIHRMQLQEEVAELMMYLLGSRSSRQPYKEESVLALLQ